jgi:hypothetical protein
VLYSALLCSALLLSSPRLTLPCHYWLGHRSFSCLESSPGRPACSCPIVARKAAQLHETTSNSGIEIEKAEEPPLRATAALLGSGSFDQPPRRRQNYSAVQCIQSFLLPGPLLDLQRHRIALLLLFSSSSSFSFIVIITTLLPPFPHNLILLQPLPPSAFDFSSRRDEDETPIIQHHIETPSISSLDVGAPPPGSRYYKHCLPSHPIPSHPNFGALSYDMPSL